MSKSRCQFTLIELILASVIALMVIVGVQQMMSIGFQSWRTQQNASNIENEYLYIHQLIHKGINTGGFFGGVEPPAMIAACWMGQLVNAPGPRLAYQTRNATFSLRLNGGTDGQIILRNEANGVELPLIGNPTPLPGVFSANQVRVDNFVVNLVPPAVTPPNIVNGEGSFDLATGLLAGEITSLRNIANAPGGFIKTVHGRVTLSFTIYNDDDRSGTYDAMREDSKSFSFSFHPFGHDIY